MLWLSILIYKTKYDWSNTKETSLWQPERKAGWQNRERQLGEEEGR